MRVTLPCRYTRGSLVFLPTHARILLPLLRELPEHILRRRRVPSTRHLPRYGGGKFVLACWCIPLAYKDHSSINIEFKSAKFYSGSERFTIYRYNMTVYRQWTGTLPVFLALACSLYRYTRVYQYFTGIRAGGLPPVCWQHTGNVSVLFEKEALAHSP